ncbi:Diacetylchitobiose uptake system permease protein NgcG [subsurface metagenome]
MKNFKLNHTNIVAYLILLGIGFFMVLPFIWMISTSLKSADEIFVFPPKFIPDKFMWSNYLKAMTEVPFLRFFFNSVYIAIVVTIGTVALCLLAGYAFAKLKFPGSDFLFFAYLATMMVPIVTTIAI